MRPSRAIRTAVTAGALVLAGCGGSTTITHTEAAVTGSLVPPAAPSHPVIELQLELPLIGLSSAPTVRYATTSGRPTFNGAVAPAGATVYMLSPDGTRTAVNPRRDGSFSVSAKLRPGANRFMFTAAELGGKSKTASLAVTWRGAAARAMQRAIEADPAKYLPPASAGLNRKLPPLGNLPAIAGGSLAATFSLNPIQAGAPPLTGGPGRWLGGFELTEYYPALEAWFRGAAVPTPGLATQHRIDWLYSAHGLSMEGDGIGLDGRQYHIAHVGAGGWLTASGGGGVRFGVGGDAPYWRTGGFWRTASGGLTFPLATGGWSNGDGVSYVSPPAGIAFAPGPSRPLAYLRSVAVDPSVIPLGSHIYIPSYRSINGGWFEADDTGGAIIGRHIDVFRPPPSNPADTGNFATGETVYIVPPHVVLP
ncbi:MAG TPA: 3D domain-containing protein [Solirubrobacteraceae bacterium]|nr:3D domain-containing protein [Solirubrobacteraceae bacterium]